MSNSKPEIDLALDIRSYERVIVLSSPTSAFEYPDRWQRPTIGDDIGPINQDTVVIVDRVEVSNQTLASIGESGPRMVAFIPADVEQEKSMRRMLVTLYPWSELWTLFTTFGKVMYTKDMCGKAYDRDKLVDMRNPGQA